MYTVMDEPSDSHETQDLEERGSIAEVRDSRHRSGKVVCRKKGEERIDLFALCIHQRTQMFECRGHWLAPVIYGGTKFLQ